MTTPYGLGRLPSPDPRDQGYLMQRVLPTVPSSRDFRYWNDSGWWGDQGSTPMCVGYAWAHWVEDGPVGHRGPTPIDPPAGIYHDAQQVDEWPGDAYDGTSVRAGAKVLQARGRITSYHWASSMMDVIQCVLEVGPVVFGTNWYESMFQPDPEGLLHVEGPVAGGHAYVVNGLNRVHGLARIKNSWGRAWGRHGHGFISFDDLGLLLSANGEACLAIETPDPPITG